MEKRIRGNCPKCKSDLIFYEQENQDNIKYICPNCNEKIKIKLITYLDIVDKFIDYYSKKGNVKPTKDDIIEAKGWVTGIKDYKGEILEGERLIQLLTFANKHDRLRKTLLRIKTEFHSNLLPKWKSYYNFIFMTISDEISLITLISNQLYEKIEQTHGVNLTDENKKEEFIVFLQQLNSLFHIIFTTFSDNLFADKEVNYLKLKVPFFLNIFNVFDKLNKIFKILLYDFPMDHGGAATKLFDFDNNGTLTEYNQIRNSIAHFHVILEDKKLMKFKILDYYNTKEKDKLGRDIKKFRIINNPHEVFQEMILLVLIIYVVLGSYQLYWQNNPKNLEREAK